MVESGDIPPKPKKSHVPRKALMGKMLRACEEGIVVVVAPLGFGKTTLVGQLYWSLHAGSNAVFFCRLGQQGESESAFRFALEPDGVSFESSYFLFEDAHLLSDGYARNLFAHLVDLANRGARIIVTADSWTNPLSHMHLCQDAVVFDKTDFAFTRCETKACMEALAGRSLSKDYIDQVCAFTLGWPAGVHLLSINAEKNLRPASFGKNRFIDEYFSSSLRDGFTLEEMEFMLKTSCLDELSASACDFVTERSDSRELLKKLAHNGAYLTFDDNSSDATCHYDKPFRLWLQNKLLLEENSWARYVNNRASSYYSALGDKGRSVKHMLMAGDSMSNFEDVWSALDFAGKGYRRDEVMLWISAMDAQEILKNPLFCVMASWFCIRSGKAREAADFANLCRSLLRGQATSAAVNESIALAHLSCIEAKSLNMAGDDRGYISAAQNLLKDVSVGDNIGLRCILTYSLAESYEHVGDVDAAQSLYRESLALSDMCGDVFAYALSVYSIARYRIMTGSFLGAEELLCARGGHCADSYKGLLHVLMARLNLVVGDLDKAHASLAQAAELLPEGSNADFRFELSIAEALLLELEGDLERAALLVMNSVVSAKNGGVRQRGILQRIQVEWARLLLRKKDYRRCEELIGEVERDCSGEKGEMPIVIATVKAGLALAGGAYEEAVRLVHGALDKATKLGFAIYWIDLKILEARILSAMGEDAAAYLCMARALDDGARFGLRSLFLRERDEIFGMLNEAVSQRKLKRATRRFCEGILREMSDLPWQGDSDSSDCSSVALRRDLLTKREQQILALLNKGLTRKEIASELRISYNTVKVHVGHIYEKLEVDNKLDAFHAAREPCGL